MPRAVRILYSCVLLTPIPRLAVVAVITVVLVTPAWSQGIKEPAAQAGKALIYLYCSFSRKPGAMRFSPIFLVNGNFLGQLDPHFYEKSYGKIEVPAGALVVAAANLRAANSYHAAYFGSLKEHFPPQLRLPACDRNGKEIDCIWQTSPVAPLKTTDSGCGNIDWRHVEKASREDIALCSGELSNTFEALSTWIDPNQKSEGIIAGLILPGTLGASVMGQALRFKTGSPAWLQMCGSHHFPDASSPEARQEAKKIQRDINHRDYSDDFTRCWDEVGAAVRLLEAERFQIQVEAGKEYYIHGEWSGFKVPTFEMRLEDPETGVKQISRLKLAPDFKPQ